MIGLPCGFGKTVLAINLICALGVKTVVLVHKKVIRDQWVSSLERFAPSLRVGYVEGKVWRFDEYDVVIAMVMTIAKRSYDPSVMDTVGFVCCDEAHHMAAPVMHLAMRSFGARYICGLTATKERPDGLTPLLHWSLGEEAFRADREGGETVSVTVALYSGATRDITAHDGKPLVSVMISKIASNHARNALIAGRIASMRASGRVILVLTHSLALGAAEVCPWWV